MAPGRELVPAGRSGPFFGFYRSVFAAVDDCDWATVAQAHERHDGWLRAFGDADSARYLQYGAAMALLELGGLDRALALVTALLEELAALGDDLWRAKALALSAEVSMRAGLHARAVEHLAAAAELLDVTPPDRHNHSSGTMALGLALQAAGAFDEAEAAFRRVCAAVTATSWMQDLSVLPEYTLLHAEWAARADLTDDAAAGHHWARVVGLALRWRRAACAAGDAQHVVRSLACEALAWTRLGDAAAAAAAVPDPAVLAEVDTASIEGGLGDLYRAHVARAEHRFGEARAHLERALAAASRSQPGVWTATVLAALAEVDVAERGPHPGVDHWRLLAQGLLATLSAHSRSFVSEVAARRQLHQVTTEADRISRDVRLDPLTGLANRRALDEALTARAGSDAPVGACFVDVDDFKRVNDSWSHAVGDAVLREVAGIISAHCRAGDLVARYGGDEFVVLTDADAASLEPLAERVRAAVAAHRWEALGAGLAVTVSVGIAPSLPAAAVLAAADAALLAAKRAGRDRVVSAV